MGSLLGSWVTKFDICIAASIRLDSIAFHRMLNYLSFLQRSEIQTMYDISKSLTPVLILLGINATFLGPFTMPWTFFCSPDGNVLSK